MRRLLLFFALLLTACQEEISLGSECSRGRGLCPRNGGEADANDDDARGPLQGEDTSIGRPDSDAGTNGPLERDAAAADTGSSDRDASQPAFDAMADEDAGPAQFPSLIGNPSFELVDGGTSIAPWYNCGATLTSVQSMTRNGPSMPRDGDTFVTYTLPLSPVPILTGLAQDLSEPLRPNQRYAFAVDVWSESATTPVLEIAGSFTRCIVGAQMGTSPPIEPGGWTTVCIAFESKSDLPVSTIMLILNAGVNFASTLHIDNIRPDPACGNWAP